MYYLRELIGKTKSGKPKTKTAKENSTNTTFEITGKGTITIEVWIDDGWKKDPYVW